MRERRMKLRYKASTFLVCFGFGFFAFANKVGNGGDGVFCQLDSPSKASSQAPIIKKPPSKVFGELLDFYEKDLKLPPSTKSYQLLASEQIQKLSPVAPKLFEKYKKRLAEIISEIEFKKDVELVDVPDSLHTFVPKNKNCQLKQLAIRKSFVLAGEKRFIIDEELWKNLDSYQQAGLILHEIIYEHFLQLGEENSIKVRKFNAYLFSQQFSKEEFWRWMQELEIPIYPDTTISNKIQ